jgi:hypothetical protein
VYSRTVTAKHCEAVEAKLDIQLHRYEPDQSRELAAYLTTLKKDGKLFSPDGSIAKKEHAAFIRNERILFQQDFHYALRYMLIIKDGVEGGGIGVFRPWEAQKILLDLIAKLEEKNIDYFERGYPCDGILVCDNKGGRQLGHTMVARAICMHRMVGWPYTRCMAASVDDDKILELYDRDKLILDNLPFFLQPAGWGSAGGGYDKKGEHILLESLGSKILYQQSKQQSGLGTGRQFDVNHNTEVSSWPYPKMLEIDFFPTLPQHPYTFSLQETTPLGRKNWWFKWSERVRHGKIPRWAYLYIPFYAEPKKYRRHPEESWIPNEQTKEMAWKVFNTSKEFVGKQVTLDREQMHWWETSYNEALENNSLNLFLSNYSITPEQSFQHTSTSAINAATMDWMRTTSGGGVAYEYEGL